MSDGIKKVRGHRLVSSAPKSLVDPGGSIEWLCECSERGEGVSVVAATQDFQAHLSAQEIAPAPLWAKIAVAVLLAPGVALVVGGVTYAAVWIWTQVGGML